MNFVTIPNTTRVVKATEQRLERIYAAAYEGLKGDTLALAAGMRPSEYRALKALDEMAEIAEMQGRADGEATHARMLAQASLAGDAKASLSILQHVHGWTAKQDIHITDDRLDLAGAISAARERLNAALTQYTIEGELTGG
jgi:hypothetical protein